MIKIPIGLPGSKKDGTPSKSLDQADAVRAAFSYQDTCLLIQICASIKKDTYSEFWTEHHEDFIAITNKNEIDAFQVKTCLNEGESWFVTDDEFIHAIQHFNKVSEIADIRRYFIYSNIDPYIPSESAEAEKTLAKSIIIVANKIKAEDNPDKLSEQIKKSVESITSKSGLSYQQVKSILSKLAFIKGPPFHKNEDSIFEYIAEADPEIKNINNKEYSNLCKTIKERVIKASMAQTSILDRHASPIQENGKSLASTLSKRLVVSDFKEIINIAVKNHKRQKLAKKIIILLLIIIMAKFLAPMFGKSQLEIAQNTFESASGNAVPAGFAEATAIIRAAHKSMMGVNLSGASLQCQDLSKLDLRRMQAESIHATGAIFDGSNLSLAFLTNSELNTAKFRNASLLQSDFSGSNMLFSKFNNSDARFSRFRKSTLQASTLSDSDFTGSDLTNADMYFADIRNSIFKDANFQGANLTDADISGSDFTEAHNITQPMLDQACFEKSHPPIISNRLKMPKKYCYSNKKEKEERLAKQFVMGVAASVSVINGFCKEGNAIHRPPDSKITPEDNIKFTLEN
ncbi:pentapeptide repeat-containing protein [Chromobacterium violaceum]|uniref:dsDNA nuclease domain-containing protein n=1 Tax=Chromobacterium violaceum TaxID=536 RepID=UPI001BE9E8CA|nr:dsDNA nuclease domain-containing protein [Chromobacterium violaceum]MBT2865913.1 pentapeptide repeat-containing protein [Chromobacterium violaceum]